MSIEMNLEEIKVKLAHFVSFTTERGEAAALDAALEMVGELIAEVERLEKENNKARTIMRGTCSDCPALALGLSHGIKDVRLSQRNRPHGEEEQAWVEEFVKEK